MSNELILRDKVHFVHLIPSMAPSLAISAIAFAVKAP